MQVVFSLFIQLRAVTLEEKGEGTGGEQLVMLMVLTRVSCPWKEPKILEQEATGKGWRVSQRQGRMCLAGDFPMASKGI